MIYYNHSSLITLINNAKYIHILPIFSTFQSSSCCKYKWSINSFQSYLFRYKCWLSYLLAKKNRYTIQFELVYIVLNTFKSFLNWFVLIYPFKSLALLDRNGMLLECCFLYMNYNSLCFLYTYGTAWGIFLPFYYVL